MHFSGIINSNPANRSVHGLEINDYHFDEMLSRQYEIEVIEQKLAEAEKRLKNNGNEWKKQQKNLFKSKFQIVLSLHSDYEHMLIWWPIKIQ